MPSGNHLLLFKTMKKNNKTVFVPELLAPAGSAEALRAVISAGADAVYIGGSRFGARAYADNPDEEELLSAIDYAHLRGVKVYLTVNTLLKEKELPDLIPFITPYYRRGIDAVLVQDFGVMRLLHRTFPDLPLHASTQMTITGPESVRFLKEYGLTRVVPARELSLAELKELKAQGLEVETFVHGALCVCYSGQCLYSSLIGGRSGNRGRCAQPCRLLYLKGKTDFDGSASILNEPEARHFLSPKDLNAIDLIPDLAGAGIDSLKIEGRMKQPEYAAGVVSVYRKYLDLYAEDPAHYHVDAADHQILWDLYNRSGFTDGYYYRRRGSGMMAFVKHELTSDETAARHALYEEMHRRYMDKEKTVPVSVSAEVRAGMPLTASFSACGVTAAVRGALADTAKNRPLIAERIAESLSKTGGSDFGPASVGVDTDGGSFVPVGALNELRRDGLAALRERILSAYRRSLPADESGICTPAAIMESSAASLSGKADISSGESDSVSGETGPVFSAVAASQEQLDVILSAGQAVKTVYLESSLLLRQKDPEYALSLIRRVVKSGRICGIAGPYIDRGGEAEMRLRGSIPQYREAGASVILVRSFETMCALMREGLTDMIRADAGIYTYNSEAAAFLRDCGIRSDTAPIELNRHELSVRCKGESELIVYGRLPLMITVQCLTANTGKCRHAFSEVELTDRMGVKFTVGCDCVFCYNIVLNSVPLNLFSEYDSIRKMGFRRLRLSFTDESAEETERILKSAALLPAAGAEARNGTFTKGHYLRGVE